MTVYLQADQISCSKEKHVNHNTLYDKRKLSPKWYTNSEDIFLYEHICTVSTGLILKHWDVYAASWNGKLYSFIFWSYSFFQFNYCIPRAEYNLHFLPIKFVNYFFKIRFCNAWKIMKEKKDFNQATAITSMCEVWCRKWLTRHMYESGL